jgi:hypothetical protein
MASASFLARFKDKSSTFSAHRPLDISHSKPVSKEVPEKLHDFSALHKQIVTAVRPAPISHLSSLASIDQGEVSPIQLHTPARRRAYLNKTGSQGANSSVFTRASVALLQTRPEELNKRSELPQMKRDRQISPKKLHSFRHSLSPMSHNQLSRHMGSLQYGAS